MDHVYDSFFDESGTESLSSFVCTGGFLFEKSGALSFEALWRQKVQPLLPDGVQYFHAVDCFHRRNGYEGISDEHVKAIFVAMSDIIKETARYGVIVGIERTDYDSLMQDNPKWANFIGSEYALCACQCAELSSLWLEKLHHDGGINYVYESSHFTPEAMTFLELIKANETMRQRHRMFDFEFKGKTQAITLQAADLLVWEFHRAHVTATDPKRHNREWRQTIAKLRVDIPIPCQILNRTTAAMRGMINALYRVWPQQR